MENITISISSELKKKLDKKVSESGFKSLLDYLNYVLEKITSDTVSTKEKAYTDDEEEAVKRRLSELGYV